VQSYLSLALHALNDSKPHPIVIGGLSGTGKTVLARGLAPQIGRMPGALVLRTDVERKTMASVDSLARLPPSAYNAETRAEIYARIFEKAKAALSSGYYVILDGVFPDNTIRMEARRLAEKNECHANMLWLEAPGEVLAERVTVRTNDASDADLTVLRQQLTSIVIPDDWTRIDASGAAIDTLANARKHLCASQRKS
jgi:hypothetical protein